MAHLRRHCNNTTSHPYPTSPTFTSSTSTSTSTKSKSSPTAIKGDRLRFLPVAVERFSWFHKTNKTIMTIEAASASTATAATARHHHYNHASRQGTTTTPSKYRFKMALLLICVGIVSLSMKQGRRMKLQTQAVVTNKESAGQKRTTSQNEENENENEEEASTSLIIDKKSSTAKSKSISMSSTSTKSGIIQQVANQKEGKGGVFFCGYENLKLAQEVFPDYMSRYKGGLDRETHEQLRFTQRQRRPEPDDILVIGMHGPCHVNARQFPGKVLFVNGEPNGGNMPDTVALEGRSTGQDVYQIGAVPDGPHTVLLYHGAWNLMRLDESVWSTLWDHSQKPINSEKYKGLMYMSSKCHAHRENAVNRISTILPIYHGGACKGLAQQNPQHPSFQRMPYIPSEKFWIHNRNAYSDYQFCMAMENSLTPYYMSEKIVMAFLAGCIPIYYGSQEVFDVFNRHAFVFYNPQDPQPALEQLAHLVQNKTAYYDMLHNQPILAKGDETVRNYFSVSDRIDGGYLKQKLRTTMGLPV